MGGRLNSKTCNTCRVFKRYEEFNVRKDSKDGYRHTCKTCLSTDRVMRPLKYFMKDSLWQLKRHYGVHLGSAGVLMDTIGYTEEDFKKHLEKSFKEGMSWSNRSKWNIDHKVSLKDLVEAGVRDIRVINSLDNLQCLWKIDNIRKREASIGSVNDLLATANFKYPICTGVN